MTEMKWGESMWEGVGLDAKRHRRNMILQHEKELAQKMANVGLPNPVGFLIDPTDGKGRLLTKFILAAQNQWSLAQAEAHIELLIQARGKQNQFPTLILVVDYDSALTIVKPLSPHSPKNLIEVKQACLPGYHPVIAIGKDGNTYAHLKVPEIVVADGAHRIDLSWVENLKARVQQGLHDRVALWKRKGEQRRKKKEDRKRREH